MKKILGNNKGFTLIELLIVFTLIAILASIGVPNYQRSVLRAKEVTLKEDLFHLRDALDQYYADSGAYPMTLDDLIDKRYLRSIPNDPFAEEGSDWEIIYDDDMEEEVSGVYDVKSSSSETALDGTYYNDW